MRRSALIVYFTFIVLFGRGYAQKYAVSVRIVKTILHSKINDATYYLTKNADDTLPIRSMNVYYHPFGNGEDSFLCTTGYLYNTSLIGPLIEYKKDHSIEQSHCYAILFRDKWYGYGSMYNTKKGTRVISYDSISHKFNDWQLPCDTVVKEGNYEFTRDIGFTGIENGVAVVYKDDKKEVTNFGFGYKYGYQKTYDLSDNLKWEIFYKRDSREGPKNLYFSCGWPNKGCGKLMELYLYKYDELEGESRSYYSSGRLQRIRNYHNNQLNGLALFYNKDSVMVIKCNYFYDSLDGHYESWYDDGAKMEEGTYDKGIKIKRWKKWDETGKLISNKVYELPPPPVEYQVAQNGIDAVVEEKDRRINIMLVENLQTNQIQKLYSAWIATKEGKPLLKFKEPVSFIIKIGYHGDVSAQANESLPEKQMASLFAFFKTLPAKEIVSQINGINFVSEAVYEVQVGKK